MGIISRTVNNFFEKRLTPSRTGLSALGNFGQQSQAGPLVSEESSLRTSAVFACVRIIAESIASLPLVVYRQDGRSRQRATDHPLYTILHDEANPELTAFEIREFLMSQTALWGNGYAYIEWSESGQVKEVWPLRSDRVQVWRRDDGQLWYYYSPSVAEDKLGARWFPFWQIHHIRGLSGDGVVGYSPIRVAALQAIGLALATEEFGARFFSNGAQPRILMRHPGRLSAEAYKRLADSFSESNAGLSNAHKTRILEEGMDISTVGIPPEEAQFLQTRKFQVTEIARIFRVPPHMLADLERATFSNIEHQSLEFVMHTLRPWLVRHEQAIRRDFLISAEEKRLYFAKYSVEGLLRGDTLARYQSYQSAINTGWMTRNEAREHEDLNPMDGGDKLLVPLNMAEAGKPSPTPGARGGGRMANGELRMGRRSAEDVGKERQKLAAAQRPLIEDVAGRVVRREVNDVRRAVQKYLMKGEDLQGFLLWLGEFYQEHEVFIGRQMGPAFDAIGRLVLASVASELDDDLDSHADALLAEVADFVDRLALRWSIGNRNELEALIREAGDGETLTETGARVEGRLDDWAETEPGKVGGRESVRSVSAFALAAYGLAGVLLLRWVTGGSKTCAYCQSLNGKIVGRGDAFVPAGDFHPEGADAPMKIRGNTFHPPVHDGCVCSIVASQ